jgi:hypothetical protein
MYFMGHEGGVRPLLIVDTVYINIGKSKRVTAQKGGKREQS